MSQICKFVVNGVWHVRASHHIYAISFALGALMLHQVWKNLFPEVMGANAVGVFVLGVGVFIYFLPKLLTRSRKRGWLFRSTYR